MTSKNIEHLSPEKLQQLKAFRERFRKALEKRPQVSDEEFMAETEVEDEQYAMGLVLPGIADEDE
jgi:hypothetical protein